jgi:nitroreductase
MEFDKLILERQSCRNYDGRLVEIEKLSKIVQDARLAPSACNSQPWFLHVVTDPDKIKEVASATRVFGANRHTEKAGAFIVLEEKLATLKEGVSKMVGSQHFAQIDMGILSAHIIMSATNNGLATCMIGLFDKNAVKKTLSLDKSAELKLVIAVGYASGDDKIRDKVRKPTHDVSNFI